MSFTIVFPCKVVIKNVLRHELVWVISKSISLLKIWTTAGMLPGSLKINNWLYICFLQPIVFCVKFIWGLQILDINAKMYSISTNLIILIILLWIALRSQISSSLLCLALTSREYHQLSNVNIFHQWPCLPFSMSFLAHTCTFYLHRTSSIASPSEHFVSSFHRPNKDTFVNWRLKLRTINRCIIKQMKFWIDWEIIKNTLVYFASISWDLLLLPATKLLVLLSTPMPVFSVDVLRERWLDEARERSTAIFGFTAVILDIELRERFFVWMLRG